MSDSSRALVVAGMLVLAGCRDPRVPGVPDPGPGWPLAVDAEGGHISGLAAHPEGLVALGTGPNHDLQGVLLGAEGDGYVASFDHGGGLLWARRLAAPGHATTDGLQVLGDGSILFAGSFVETLTLGEVSVVGSGPRDCFVARVSASGETLALAAFGGSGETLCRGVSVNGERLTVVGMFSGSLRLGSEARVSRGTLDVMVFELELQRFAVTRALSFGSAGEDVGRGVLALDDERFVVVGSYGSPWGAPTEPGETPEPQPLRFSSGAVLEPLGDADGFVAELDWQGRARWQMRFADVGFDVVKSIAHHDGGYIVGATQQAGAPPPGVSGLASDVPLSGFVAAISGDGEERWRWADENIASPHAVVPLPDGRSFVAGHYRPGLQVAGVRWDTAGDLDAMLVVLSPDGVPVGGWHCGGPGLDLGFAAEYGASGLAYLGGSAGPSSTCTGTPREGAFVARFEHPVP